MSRLLPELANLQFKFKPQRHTDWLALSPSALAWIAPDSKGTIRFHTKSWDGALSTLMHLIADLTPQHPTVILCPSLAKHWLQACPVGIASLHELHVIAGARAEQLFGAPSELSDGPQSGWHVGGDWHATHDSLCTAWPAGLTTLKVKLNTAFNLALAVYRLSLPNIGWVAITVAGELHLIQIAHRRIVSLRSTTIALTLIDNDLEDYIAVEWQRELLRRGTQAEHLHWLHLMPNSANKHRHPSLKPIRWDKSPDSKLSGLPMSSDDKINEALATAWAVGNMQGGRL